MRSSEYVQFSLHSLHKDLQPPQALEWSESAGYTKKVILKKNNYSKDSLTIGGFSVGHGSDGRTVNGMVLKAVSTAVVATAFVATAVSTTASSSHTCTSHRSSSVVGVQTRWSRGEGLQFNIWNKRNDVKKKDHVASLAAQKQEHWMSLHGFSLREKHVARVDWGKGKQEQTLFEVDKSSHKISKYKYQWPARPLKNHRKMATFVVTIFVTFQFLRSVSHPNLKWSREISFIDLDFFLGWDPNRE